PANLAPRGFGEARGGARAPLAFGRGGERAYRGGGAMRGGAPAAVLLESGAGPACRPFPGGTLHPDQLAHVPGRQRRSPAGPAARATLTPTRDVRARTRRPRAPSSPWPLPPRPRRRCAGRTLRPVPAHAPPLAAAAPARVLAAARPAC